MANSPTPPTAKRAPGPTNRREAPLATMGMVPGVPDPRGLSRLARHLRRLRPDVALVDEDMPCFGGAAIARVLRSELPETRVVVMTRIKVGGCR